MSGRRISAMRSSSASSSISSSPRKRATTATVMSSAVGPSPPLVTIRSTPWSAMKRSCASMSCGRSPQIVMCASSTPSSSSRSDSHGPFRSRTRPVSTSVPVTTIPARALKPSSRAWPLARGERGSGSRTELEPHWLGARSHRHEPAVNPHSDVRLAEVHAQEAAPEHLGGVEDALEYDRGPGAPVDADVRGRYRGDSQDHPPRWRWLPFSPRLVARRLCGLRLRDLRALVFSRPQPPRHERRHDSRQHQHEHRPGAEPQPAAPPVAGDLRPERLDVVDLVTLLVGGPVLLHERVRVQPQHLRVGAHEGLDEGRAGEHPELLVFERTQVLRADLGSALDIRDVEMAPHSGLAERFPDGGHRARIVAKRFSPRRALQLAVRRAARAPWGGPPR